MSASRRELVRSGVLAAGCGAIPLLAGCSGGRHHRPGLLVSNSAPARHRVSVTITRPDGSRLFDERVRVPPDDSVEFAEVFPRPGTGTGSGPGSESGSGDGTGTGTGPDDGRAYRVVASLAAGTTRRAPVRPRSGFHRLWIEVESATSIRIVPVVH